MSEYHKTNGAVFAEREGWNLPLHFGETTAEYDAVRSHLGLLDLSHRALLHFTGPDRTSFLQGMISNDLLSLSPGGGLYAMFLNQQGKVLGDCRVFCTDSSLLLDLWEPIKEKILDHLNRYLVADEVEITDLTEHYGLISVQGPDSERFVRKIAELPEAPKHLFLHSIARVYGTDIRLVRSSHTGEDGFDFIIPKSGLLRFAQHLDDVGKHFSAAWVGEQAAEILRVESGIPRYGIDITEDHLLLETGLDHAVSFTKGCYLGQETVERIRSRGHVNKKLVGFLLEGQETACARDLIVSADKEVGTITSSVYSPTLARPIALGYLRRDSWSTGTSLSVTHDGAPIPATVTDLPFVKPKK